MYLLQRPPRGVQRVLQHTMSWSQGVWRVELSFRVAVSECWGWGQVPHCPHRDCSMHRVSQVRRRDGYASTNDSSVQDQAHMSKVMHQVVAKVMSSWFISTVRMRQKPAKVAQCLGLSAAGCEPW